ncbi:MAG: phosphate ABC transporter permease subunit PstC [Thermaerobacter sp.]|nr:phosphate ABC transporter permease subunit PstC [Thermaerobacter sp.]
MRKGATGGRAGGALDALQSLFHRRVGDILLKVITGAIAGGALAAMLAILIFLLRDSWPSILYNGWHFVTTLTWNIGSLYSRTLSHHNGATAASGAAFGIVPFIVGTMLSSLIAVILAIPLAVALALLLVEYLPARIGDSLSFVVEMLAGVPSVVLGLWGIAVLIPWIGHDFGPFLSHWLGWIPFFKGPIGSGQGLLASGLILTVMITPIIAASTRDVLRQTPRETKDGALALGLTRWEVIRGVSLPWASSGIFGAVVLGLGRALGETMAVLMVSGSAANYLPQNIYSPIGTMAATIVSQLDSAMTDPTGMAVHALAEVALVLFLISVVVNVPARLLLSAAARRGGSEAQ